MVVTLVASHAAMAIATVLGGKGGRGARGGNGGAVRAVMEDKMASITRHVNRDILLIPDFSRVSL